MKKPFLIFLIMLLLSACTTMKPPVSITGDNWTLQGKVGIQTPQKTESASLYWRQTGDIYSIRLFGPLGIGAVELNGNPEQVTFTDNRGQNYQAPSAEVLLKQNLGWQLPIKNLTYWIRALPAPEYPSQKSYDQNHYLISLQQQGWQINYLEYRNNHPRLIQLTRPQFRLRIVIDKWQ
jgi:outer membrane lipoprotein LolB